MNTQLRQANKEDGWELATLINIAGAGLPEYLWLSMAEEGESAMETGARRAAREEGGFSYRNAIICHVENNILGMVLSYRQDDPYTIEGLENYPLPVQPLVKLESQAPGSWYINAIATYEKYRGQGVASKLMAKVEALAESENCQLLSLIVASDNNGAKSLFEHLGFKAISSLAMVEYPGSLHPGNWELMTKSI